MDAQDFPVSLQHGIPPALTHRFTGTYWGQQPLHTTTQHIQARLALGIRDSSRHQRHVAEAQDMEAQAQYERIQDQMHAQSYDARQAFQALRGQHEHMEPALPSPCTEAPPEDINVYSDGGLHDPTEPSYSLGGSRVWWPTRNMDDIATCEAEANMAILQQQP